MHTLNRASLKQIYWLILAEDNLFNLWKKVCQMWLDGIIPDGVGETGNKRPGKMITPAPFRCFEGDISPEEIMTVLKSLLKGDVLLKKDASYKSSLPTMLEKAHTMKIMRKLKLQIVQILIDKHPEMFNTSTTWESAIKILPTLGRPAELDRCRWAAGELFLQGLLKRNAPKEDIPQGLVIRIDALFCAEFGGSARKRTEPFLSFYSDNLMKTMKPEVFDEHSPQCPLAILDFSRQRQREWTDSELAVLFHYIVELSGNTTIVVVITVLPGILCTNVIQAVNRLGREKKLSIHYEFGSYSRMDERLPEGRLWSGAKDQVIFAGISSDDAVRWKDIFKPEALVAAFYYDDRNDLDFRGRNQRLEKSQGKDVENSLPTAGEGGTASPSEVKEIMESAPTYEMVGHRGGYVNPDCKPQKMIKAILTTLSAPGDTVLDFFSGGQVLKCCLLFARECFAYSDTQSEYDFTQAYARKIYEDIPSIKTTFSMLPSSDQILRLEDLAKLDSRPIQVAHSGEVTSASPVHVQSREAITVTPIVIPKYSKTLAERTTNRETMETYNDLENDFTMPSAEEAEREGLYEINPGLPSRRSSHGTGGPDGDHWATHVANIALAETFSSTADASAESTERPPLSGEYARREIIVPHAMLGVDHNEQACLTYNEAFKGEVYSRVNNEAYNEPLSEIEEGEIPNTEDDVRDHLLMPGQPQGSLGMPNIANAPQIPLPVHEVHVAQENELQGVIPNKSLDLGNRLEEQDLLLPGISKDGHEAVEASKSGAPQAGASNSSTSHSFCSSNDKLVFLSNSASSPVILRRSNTARKILGKTGWIHEDAECIHYIWLDGPNKGKSVSRKDATRILIDPEYKKKGDRLKPVFSKPTFVQEAPSVVNSELQSMLGAVTLDEYGSFTT